MSPHLTYSNSIKIAIGDKPSGGDSVLHVARPSHQFGGDWVSNEEVDSGMTFGLITLVRNINKKAGECYYLFTYLRMYVNIRKLISIYFFPFG
jgi:hypothetical protein